MGRNFHLGGGGVRVLSTAVLATALAVGVILLGFTSTAKADSTITVTTDADEQNTNGQCSLREAILNANNNDQSGSTDCTAGSSSGADTINFTLGSSATIKLDSTLPPITITDPAGLTIDGGNASITISGDNKVRVLQNNATLTVQNLTVANGLTTALHEDGGGIFNAANSTLTVANSTFSDNSVTRAGGGGIFNGFNSTITVTNSTFSGNSASSFGGGIFNVTNSTLTVTNSTFSNNSADQRGGGIGNAANSTLTVTVTNSTFSGNSAQFGGGIANADTANPTNLKNTILANSTNGGNCGGSFTDDDYNLSDDSSCNFSTAHSKNNTNPQFAGGLDNNGGPTQTIALQPRSPAVDAIPPGDNGCGTDITTDQRGVSRPQRNGCDIGAFEVKDIPPVANDDSYSTDEDQTLNVDAGSGVLKNDTDPDGDPLTAAKVSEPTHGTLTLNSDGSFTYTPNAGFSGTDSFTYKANDGSTDSSAATVTITVNGLPVANNDSYSTDEDQTLNVDAASGVLKNDTDPENDPLTAVKASDPSNGTLTLNSDGSFSYTPTAGFSGSDSFTYKAQDATAHTSNTATVSITVNSAPPATTPASSCHHHKHRPHKHPHHKHIHYKPHKLCGKGHKAP